MVKFQQGDSDAVSFARTRFLSESVFPSREIFLMADDRSSSGRFPPFGSLLTGLFSPRSFPKRRL
jgi:hypothetical protein